MIVLIVFALSSLVCCWVWSDVTVRTKCVFSGLYFASWLLLLIPFHALYLFPLAQFTLAFVIGGVTFGIDWLMRDAHHWR